MGEPNSTKRKIFMKRLLWPIKVLEDTPFSEALQHRIEIYNRLIRYMKLPDQSEAEFLERVCNDFDVFCAFFISLPIVKKSTGEDFMGAMYPSIAQSRMVQLIEKNRTVYIVVNRQSGKSRMMSAYALYKSIRKPNSTINLLAPTKQQLQIMRDVKGYCDSIDFIRHRFVLDEKSGGKLSNEHIVFGFNGSQINSMNLGQAQKGDYKRGLRGDCIVDEVFIVDSDVMENLIAPLQSSAYADVKLIFTGTPSLKFNPDIQQTIESAKDREGIGLLHVGCWESIELGATTAGSIADRFHDLRIPCEYGRQGFCPKFYKEGGYFIKPNPKYANFECNKVCYENDSFVMENLAEFPVGANRVFPAEWLYACSRPNLSLIPVHNISQRPPGSTRVMSIDIGVIRDATAVIFADDVVDSNLKQSVLQVVGWYEIPPLRDMSLGSNPIRDNLQNLYMIYKPSIIYIDVTRNEDFVWNLMHDGENPIPRSKFYACPTQKRKESVGVWWGNQTVKHELVVNHRTQINQGRWVVPQSPPDFFERWFDDHFKLRLKEGSSENYMVYTRTGHTLAAAMMASLYLSGKKNNSFVTL